MAMDILHIRVLVLPNCCVVVFINKPGTGQVGNSPDAPARAHFFFFGQKPREPRETESFLPTGPEDAAAWHPVASPCPLVYKTQANEAFATRPKKEEKTATY